HQPDQDLITYNNNFKPVNEVNELSVVPFTINNQKKLIERYMGKCLFMNWPHFEYGIVCAISDYKQLYVWQNIPGESVFSLQSSYIEDAKHYTQTPVYVTHIPFEYDEEKYNDTKIIYSTRILSEEDGKNEYSKAMNISRRYEVRQGIHIGHIPLLLYISPLIGYRTQYRSSTSDKCSTYKCFSNQAYPYPLQTCLFQLPNYRSDKDLFQFPQTINDHFKINDPVFSLVPTNYSCDGQVQNVIVHNGKHIIECKMNTNAMKQPDIHAAQLKLQKCEIIYYTAQEVAKYLKTHAVSGTIVITSGNRNVVGGRLNIGLSWKMNYPVRQLQGYTKKLQGIWCYSDEASKVIADYMKKFPEVVAYLVKHPSLESYSERSIWPSQNGKTRAMEIRTWIKSLPTYSMQLTDASWMVLDTPVIEEINSMVTSFYAKQTNNRRHSSSGVSRIETSRLFKPCEYLGLCDPDPQTSFFLHDRVVVVRLGAGVPIGSRGTVIGIMPGRTHLDTYYEILFDHLPNGSLYSILFNDGQQQCRVKVRSYHLLNFTHSLRFNAVYKQRSISMVENVRDHRLVESLIHPSLQPQYHNMSVTNENSHPRKNRALNRGISDNNGNITTGHSNVVRNKSNIATIDYHQLAAQKAQQDLVQIKINNMKQGPRSRTPPPTRSKSMLAGEDSEQQSKSNKKKNSSVFERTLPTTNRQQDQRQLENHKYETNVTHRDLNKGFIIPQSTESSVPSVSSVNRIDYSQRTSGEQIQPLTSVVLPPTSSFNSSSFQPILSPTPQQSNDKPVFDLSKSKMNPDAPEFVMPSKNYLHTKFLIILNDEKQLKLRTTTLSSNRKEITTSERSAFTPIYSVPFSATTLITMQSNTYDSMYKLPQEVSAQQQQQPSFFSYAIEQMCKSHKESEQQLSDQTNDANTQSHQFYQQQQYNQNTYLQNSPYSHLDTSSSYPLSAMPVNNNHSSQYNQNSNINDIVNMMDYSHQQLSNDGNHQHNEANGVSNQSLNKALIEQQQQQQQNQYFPSVNDYDNSFLNTTMASISSNPNSLLYRAICESEQFQQVAGQQQSTNYSNNNISYTQQYPQMMMLPPFKNNVEPSIPMSLPSYQKHQPPPAAPVSVAPPTSTTKPSASTLQFIPSQVLRNIPK
ncbi:unnamed protein product, partial [Didymodactylos carnosus]